MKFTLSWLLDHLDTEATLDEIAATLTRVGLEVESVLDPRAALAPFRIARVIEAVPHPNADRLRVCRVDTGTGEVQVVCGAPNARTGMTGVFAPAGAFIPGTGITLEPANIRGVDSRGMLCSEREMMLSDDHEGIIELPADAPVGAAFAPWAGLDDPVVEIAVTPNRPDALGVSGIARDLAAAGLGKLKLAVPEPVAGDFDCPVPLAIDDLHACPVFSGRLVRGLVNGPSPRWLQQRLKAIGLRPISALVDITNYSSVDRGRPLHVYDAAKITGTVRARAARPGESFVALDGRAYETRGGECLIADDAGPLGFGGVMGGEASGSSAATVDVFIESALFDPVLTAETGRRHRIDSDARYRFERGVDPAFVLPGLDLATRMVLEFCGGTPSRPVVAGAVPGTTRQVLFDPDRVRRLGGIDVPARRSRELLTRLGFGWQEQDGGVAISVPSWRPDIDGEADIVEEVLRIEGYDAIAPVSLPRLHAVARPTLSAVQRRARAVKSRLASEGLDEAVTWSFMDSRIALLFGGTDALRLENPISAELDMMRPSVLPNLLAAARRNHHRGVAAVALFEVGPAYAGTRPEDQAEIAAILRSGVSGPRHWRDGGRPVDLHDAKRDALAALEAAGAPVANLQIERGAPDWYHPGRSGTLRLGPKTVLATFGELHPRSLASLGLEGPCAAVEICLDQVPLPRRKTGRARPVLVLSNLPAVERDFSFLVPRETPVGEMVRAARSADRKHIVAVEVFDLYEGPGVAVDMKSVALAVRLEPQTQTFTDDEIETISRAIVVAVERKTGGKLRR